MEAPAVDCEFGNDNNNENVETNDNDDGGNANDNNDDTIMSGNNEVGILKEKTQCPTMMMPILQPTPPMKILHGCIY